MFNPFPGFEKVTIRVKVEWQERRCLFKLRIEQLPTEPVRAVPVCSFIDNPEWGEWLIVQGDQSIYTLEKLNRLVRVHSIFREGKRQDATRHQLNFQPVEGLKNVVERALDPLRTGTRFVKVLQHNDLPLNVSQIALLFSGEGRWLRSWLGQGFATARFIAPTFDLCEYESHYKPWMQSQFNDSTSDVYLAWQWATWSDAQHLTYALGSHQSTRQIEDALRWILLCTPSIWECSPHHAWQLRWNHR